MGRGAPGPRLGGRERVAEVTSGPTTRLEDFSDNFTRVWIGVHSKETASAQASPIDIRGTRFEARISEPTVASSTANKDVYTTVSVHQPGGAAVAAVKFLHKGGTLYPESALVDPSFRRRGIATAMYEAAERKTGMPIVASNEQTDAGSALSRAFRSRRSTR